MTDLEQIEDHVVFVVVRYEPDERVCEMISWTTDEAAAKQEAMRLSKVEHAREHGTILPFDELNDEYWAFLSFAVPELPERSTS